MPGFDRSGPNGQGIMTGKRMGCCTNFSAGARNQAPEVDMNMHENFVADSRPGNFCRRCGGGLGYGRAWKRGFNRGFGWGFGRGAQNGNGQV